MNSTQQAALDQPEYALWKRIARSNMESAKKIHAIAELRRVTGMGLKDAKDVVEAYMDESANHGESAHYIKVKVNDRVTLEVTRHESGKSDIRVTLYQDSNLSDDQLLNAIVRLTKEYGGD